MRAWAAIVVAIISVGPSAAQLPALGEPTGVDVRVRSVSWHPHGLALLYTREEASGIGIGVYVPGQPEGRLLVHLGNGDRWESQWFESGPSAIVHVYRTIPDEKEPLTQVSVHVLDARQLAEKLVFQRAYPASQKVDLDVDTSPRYVHAIFRLKGAAGTSHLVLTAAGTPLVASPDIDAAVKDGYAGPVWSVNGTAVYSKGTGGTMEVAVSPARDGDAALVQKVAVSLYFESAGVLDRSLASKFILSHPVPEVGAAVMEVMPSNGVLRPVRFPGPWAWRERGVPALGQASRQSLMKLGLSTGYTQSLWLTAGEPRPEKGALVAAHAEQGWISPGAAAIAYITHGALFVRQLKR